MKTLLSLGPRDQGRQITEEEWEAAVLEEGHRYEIIDGRLVVSPAPEAFHDSLYYWLLSAWSIYAHQHPEIINYVTANARVYIPTRPRLTVPEPDLAAYADYPWAMPARQRRWRFFSPVFVGEIVSEDNAEKDLVRNVEIYQDVPSIREYWLLHPRGDEVQMLVYRRRGSRWQRVIEVAEGETYTSRLFPGLEVTLTPQ